MSGLRPPSLHSAFAAVVVAMICGQALAAPRVALVIGNASYAYAPALANPLHDAADVGAALGRLGFEVTRLENADRASLWRGFQEFARAASASEVAVVFYAGHGIEVDQRNFLVPVDARLASDRDVEFEAVPLELVQRAVERSSKLRLVILDACRENPFAVSMRRAGATRSIGRGLGRVEPAGETLVAYAAKEGTVAADGTGRNSPYSEALLAHVEEPGLEVGLMFRKVRDAVLASTGGRQEPFVYGSLSSRETYLAAGLASEPALPAGGPNPVIVPGAAQVTAEQLAAERVYWESVKGSTDPAELHGYLERYPGGTFEVLARSRLRRLEGDPVQPEPPVPASASAQGPSPDAARMEVERLAAEREFWTTVKASTDPAELQAYLDRYPDGIYVVLARSRLKRMEATTEPADASEVGSRAETVASVGSEAASPPAVLGPVEPTPEEVEASLGLSRKERRRIQQGLESLGFAPGPVDGLFGARTREAVLQYQGAKGLRETKYLTEEQARALAVLGVEAARAQAQAVASAGATAAIQALAPAETPPAPEAASDDRVDMLSHLQQSGPIAPATPKHDLSALVHRIPDPGRLPIPANYGVPGEGSFTGSDASRYVGAYHEQKPHGFGTYTWADGDRYKGRFRRGKMHGRGTYTFPDGRVWSCEWRKNVVIAGSCEHDLSVARTWKAKDRVWNIELKMSGDYIDASIYNATVATPLKCRGEVSDAGEIDVWCPGGGNWASRKLVGTFPNLKLRNPGSGSAGGATFTFSP